jgi:hypothetical protein
VSLATISGKRLTVIKIFDKGRTEFAFEPPGSIILPVYTFMPPKLSIISLSPEISGRNNVYYYWLRPTWKEAPIRKSTVFLKKTIFFIGILTKEYPLTDPPE